MAKKYDITAAGECLYDFTVETEGENGAILMRGNPGGAPLNVLAAAVKLGSSAAFISKLSTDVFGRQLLETIRSGGISEEGLVYTDSRHTALAIVTLDKTGDRSFSFYRDGTADVALESGEINRELVDDSRIFHFGSVSMTCEPVRSATLAAASYAREQGLIVSFDPNLREMLWTDLDEARRVIQQGLSLSEVVKVSQEELDFLTFGKADGEDAAEKLRREYGISLLAVTYGPGGAAVFSDEGSVTLPTYSDVKTIDTTGAGDAFWGAFLHRLVQSGRRPDELDLSQLRKILDFANAAGSLSTTLRGAIPSMPTAEQVEQLIISAQG